MRLLYVARHLASIVILPGTVVYFVPVWIARRYRVPVTPPATFAGIMSVAVGLALALIGVALFVSALRRFAVEGDGTLAPWDPPRRLVLRGPYRYVRNPMISGVIFLLAAEAALLRSTPHFVWMLTFLVVNAVYIPLLEEPILVARFGRDYGEYCRHVRRFIPRLRPWDGL